MAFGIVMRQWSFIPVATAFALVQGCLATTGDDDGSGGSSGTSGTGGTAGSGGSATGGTAGSTGIPCDEGDPILCPSADDMSLCIDGSYQTLDCVAACAGRGFEGGPCAEPKGCACGFPTDAACELGVNAFCACVEGTDTPCDASDAVTAPLDLYLTCHLGDPLESAQFLSCLGDHVDAAGNIDCQAAVDACS